MSASTVKCHVLNGDVSVVSDLNGKVTNVVCPQFSRFDHTCNLKTQDVGLIGRLASRAADKFGGQKMTACEFIDPNDSAVARFADSIFPKP